MGRLDVYQSSVVAIFMPTARDLPSSATRAGPIAVLVNSFPRSLGPAIVFPGIRSTPGTAAIDSPSRQFPPMISFGVVT